MGTKTVPNTSLLEMFMVISKDDKVGASSYFVNYAMLCKIELLQNPNKNRSL